MDSESIPGLVKQLVLAAWSLDDERLLELLDVAERLQADAEAERTARESFGPAPTPETSSQSGCRANSGIVDVAKCGPAAE